MSDLLFQNKEWLFSGLGIAMITAFVALLKRILKASEQTPVGAVRERNFSKAVAGRWEGSTQVIDGKGRASESYEVVWDFFVEGDQVRADSTMKYVEDGVPKLVKYQLTGQILHDRFLKLEYWNCDDRRINFGSEVLQICDNGDSFTGRFVGFSSDDASLVSGTMSGRKCDVGS